MQVAVIKRYDGADGQVRAVEVDLGDRQCTVTVATGVVGWSTEWLVNGPFTYGRNYGPGTFGHTDVVVKPDVLAAIKAAL